MTSFRLPPTERERLRAALRAHAEQWIKRFYRHEILVARAVKGIQDDASAEFLRTVAEPIIRQVAAGLAGFERRGQDVIVDQTPELRRLMAEVRQQVQRAVLELQRTTKAAIKDLVGQETAWVTESAEKVLRLGQVRPVSLPAIEDAVDRRPYLGGKTEEWFGSLVDGDNGVVDNVRFAVQTGVQRGLSTDEIVRVLRGSTKAVDEGDGLITGSNVQQVRAMVRTAASHASATARMETFKQLGVDRYQFVATLDSRTSIQCAANDGKTFPLGEGPMPPLHPNAVLAGSTFVPYGRLEEFVHAAYRGPCIHVRAGCDRTTIGPNHPMLTARGMVKAAELRKGDKLLRDRRHDGPLGQARESNLEQVPMVEHVLGSLLASGAHSVVATAGHDLHGDRIFCHGEVGVVVPDRFLLPVLDSQGIEQLRKLSLMPTDMRLNTIASLRSGKFGRWGVLLPSSSGVGGTDTWVLADDHWEWVAVDDVSEGWFEGMAFDATTQSSLYCSDGFVVSNCRSTVIPYTGDEPIGNRASVDGPVPAGTNFRGWLEDQPQSVQDEVLGPSRAAAWRAGDLTFEQMVGKDLLPISVAELKKKDLIPNPEDEDE